MLLTAPLRALIPVRRPDPAARGVRATLGSALESVLGTAAGSLAASLATAPPVATAFHRASLVAVLSNCVALPVASGLTVLAASSAAALAVATTPAAILVCLADPLSRALLYLSHLFATLPFAATLVAQPSATFCLAWYAALAALALKHSRPKLSLRLALPAIVVLAACALWRVAGPHLTRELTVTFLAVGQGDGALVQLPGGEALLIDGGGDPAGRFDPGERVVVPALAELGATRLRAAVLSHPHPDHLNGLASALTRVRADELWIARGMDRGGPLLHHLLEVASSRGVPVRELSAGDRVDLGSALVEVLHPARGWEGYSENDASLVLRLRFKEVSFLFPGDIEAAGEDALLSSGDPATTVLKAPHHGSRTSSTPDFVSRVHAAHVVFPVGHNRFGFPHPEVVERWRAAGAQTHRTDTEGAIRVETDGQTVRVEPFVR